LCTHYRLFVFIVMIAIPQGANSSIYVTLTDKRETSSNVYIFRFNHEVTNEEVILTLTDISTFKDRVSKFAITIANFTDRTIGFWRYNVTQSGSGSEIIATGKMQLTAANLSTAGVIRYNGYNGDYKTYTTT
jgi:hypothetical protein